MRRDSSPPDSDPTGCGAKPRRSPRSALRPERWTKSREEFDPVAYKFAFVMDPLEAVLPDKDTTFVFMLEALRRGHELYHLGLRGLHAHGNHAFANARRCEVARAQPHFRFLDHGAQYP